MTTSTPDMISTDSLKRTFRGPDKTDVVAVDDISLTVPRGQTLAILGPNGAGKSTFMRMLSTLLPPSGGSAEVAGLDVVRRAHDVRALLGYVGQGGSAGYNQKARDEVINQARIYGADRHAAAQRASELFATFGLEGLEQRRGQEMSGGQRRRLDLAMGLVHQPRLLFLDEPTTGLDPQNRANLWEHIRRIREETDMTIVVTTHYLDEADSMAERIVIVDHGTILADGTPHQLKHDHVGSHVTLGCGDARHAETLARSLATHADVLAAQVAHDTVTARVTDAHAALPRLIAHALTHDVTVTTAYAQQPTLDDVFLTLTGRSLRDAATETKEQS